MSQTHSFAFVTMGSGGFLGSTVRDLALANALHRRGYKVAVYWMMELNEDMADPGIRQRTLCHGSRYHFRRPSQFLDRVLGPLLFLLPQRWRVRIVQSGTGYVDRLLENLVSSLYGPGGADAKLAQRLLEFITEDEVSHLMLSFATIGPLALAAQRLGGRDFDYLLTFQGDEQFAAYARRIGLQVPYCQSLNEVVRHSPWPAIVVSHDYALRIMAELKVPRCAMQVVYNGVELPSSDEKPSFAQLRSVFPDLVQETPIVLFLGRQECEKGIDLLLYAARMLAGRNVPMQLVICGSTARGGLYRKVLSDLAEHLGLSVHHAGSVSNQVRNALYAHSHCVVYPSVNREPFGLVVAEAMGHGAPVLVPDYGGIGEVIRHGDKAAGLTFKTWDSGDLARQLERLLVDEDLYRVLEANTRSVAARFCVDNMARDVLAHIGVGKDEELIEVNSR